MIEIDEKLKNEYDLPFNQIRSIKASKYFIRFQGVECFKCKTKHNIPIFNNISLWNCGVCQI